MLVSMHFMIDASFRLTACMTPLGHSALIVLAINIKGGRRTTIAFAINAVVRTNDMEEKIWNIRILIFANTCHLRTHRWSWSPAM